MPASFLWFSLCIALRPSAPAPEFPEMLLIGGGIFPMGDARGDADEKPVRSVFVPSFYLGKTEITLAQFGAFVHASGYRSEAERGDGSYVWTDLGWAKKAGVDWRCDEKGQIRPATEQAFPVVHVSWNDAAQYCNWLSAAQKRTPVYRFDQDTVWVDSTANGYRLPGEAEWEYAAGGGAGAARVHFAGSQQIAEVAWYAGNSKKSAHPVGLKKPNALGLYDCTGNVWEWCQREKDVCSIRGGSWSNNPAHCRISNRSRRFADMRDCNLGFRVACSETRSGKK
ncbi:MAG: formylglycine-generating enzyme family protein [Saprospiraceae bacterium]|nr:formylglycine-generating enzyme family protein [Saprospiraceae bacterium]